MTRRSVDLDYVVNHCDLVATEHKMLSVSDAPRRNEHLAKAQAADEIAAHFRDGGEAMSPAHDVEDVARQIDPRTYAAYDALVRRMIEEGKDEAYALRVAEATYGADLSEARAQAADSIAAALSADPAEAGYDKGLADAIAWHEGEALKADRMESIERTGERKAKYRQRASRHRLYAKRMKEDLEAAKEIERQRRRVDEEAKEPLLPFGRHGPDRKDEGIPLEVQRMFLRRGEVMDDEGFV